MKIRFAFRPEARQTRRSGTIPLIIEPLEGRALLANIFEINSAVIQREAGRVAVRSSLSDNVNTLRSDYFQFKQQVNDKLATIQADFLATKQQLEADREQEQADQADDDATAVADDKDAIAADNEAIQTDRGYEVQVITIGRQATDLSRYEITNIYQDAKVEDRAVARDQREIRNGSDDPATVLDNAETSDANITARGQTQFDTGESRLNSLNDQISAIPDGASGGGTSSGGSSGGTSGGTTGEGSTSGGGSSSGGGTSSGGSSGGTSSGGGSSSSGGGSDDGGRTTTSGPANAKNLIGTWDDSYGLTVPSAGLGGHYSATVTIKFASVSTDGNQVSGTMDFQDLLGVTDNVGGFTAKWNGTRYVGVVSVSPHPLNFTLGYDGTHLVGGTLSTSDGDSGSFQDIGSKTSN